MADGDDAAGITGAAPHLTTRRDALAHVARTAAEMGRVAAEAGLAEVARLLSRAAAEAAACSRGGLGDLPPARAGAGG